MSVDSRPRVLSQLRSLLDAEGGPLAAAVADAERPAPAALGALAAAGERAREAPDEYALLVESIFEGYLVHYAEGRIVAAATDEDMRLLAGDYLFAVGLERLARLGDLAAVEELGDLIALCAGVHARAANGRRPWALTGGLWGLCVLAVTAGAWPEHGEAKEAARRGEAGAAALVRETAIARAIAIGLRLELERSLIVFRDAVERPLSTK
jgi:hypothetical protein